ncbi:MAG TPA: hypothetical protein VKE22_21760 [Haliangiales bacterium]|nr:hypothetical protein [Haliangiales bacterium]
MSRWSTVSPVALGAFLVGTALLGLAVRATGGFVPVLDHANLAFHEAGHLVYGIFGRTAELYGGTLGQLTFPVVAIVAFAWRGSTLGVAVAGVWLFENFFNIARYAADARAQLLPLVGGGEHDWENILLRWRALDADLRVAKVLRVLGVLGWLAVAGWLVWRSRQRE